jgi:hypothetical protein
LEVVTQTSALAALGAEKGLWKEKDVEWIFRTVALECTDPRDKWLYLKTCQANGLSPLKRELFAIPYKGRITFVTSYHVFVSRARSAGFVLTGQDVCANDTFEGWDAAACKPVKHIVKATNRGNLLGAWAHATNLKTGEIVTGKYWPKSELLSENKNPLRDKIPGHFCWKTAVARIARLIAPDLSSLYGAEEFGVLVSDDRESVPREVKDILPEQPEDQVRAQTQPDVDGGQGDEPEDAEVKEPEVIPPSTKLDFKSRAAVMKALAMKGHTKAPDILARLSEITGRTIEHPQTDLLSCDWAALSEALEVGDGQ